ncbi:COMM domain-containing protein 4-like isoform X3 [Ruditapes philippinarum]|uniref:COMM domain-containing protein 4-like isoform X3 n=1 Tax=Ruditapes philippinarum TaxID=129788 RepID=UPI00295BA865|nr:COMM domain-containing protein 4-like isoform X3 [Ruditapes philippinarum]
MIKCIKSHQMLNLRRGMLKQVLQHYISSLPVLPSTMWMESLCLMNFNSLVYLKVIYLSNELQQLGLPKEHTTSLGKSYGDNLIKLQEQFRKDSLRLSQLEGVEWRVDYIISSSHLKDINEPCVQLKMNIKPAEGGEVEPVSFTASSDKFRVFLNELKQASAVMDNLATS